MAPATPPAPRHATPGLRRKSHRRRPQRRLQQPQRLLLHVPQTARPPPDAFLPPASSRLAPASSRRLTAVTLRSGDACSASPSPKPRYTILRTRASENVVADLQIRHPSKRQVLSAISRQGIYDQFFAIGHARRSFRKHNHGEAFRVAAPHRFIHLDHSRKSEELPSIGRLVQDEMGWFVRWLRSQIVLPVRAVDASLFCVSWSHVR